MQRYFIHAEAMNDQQVELVGDDAHHAVRVMRMAEGDQFIATDGQVRSVIAQVIKAEPTKVVASIVEQLTFNHEPAWQVTIAQSLPKGDKMEMVLQKGTEIGAFAFIPFESERTIVQYDGKKQEKQLVRWGKIVKEAAEQAHRDRLPEVTAIYRWKQLMAVIPHYQLVLFCYEKTDFTVGLRTALQQFDHQQLSSPVRVLLIVGPEGGFTVKEVQEAQASGAVIVTLGNRILRTETAALVGLSCVMFESGEMGG